MLETINIGADSMYQDIEVVDVTDIKAYADNLEGKIDK